MTTSSTTRQNGACQRLEQLPEKAKSLLRVSVAQGTSSPPQGTQGTPGTLQWSQPGSGVHGPIRGYRVFAQPLACCTGKCVYHPAKAILAALMALRKLPKLNARCHQLFRVRPDVPEPVGLLEASAYTAEYAVAKAHELRTLLRKNIAIPEFIFIEESTHAYRPIKTRYRFAVKFKNRLAIHIKIFIAPICHLVGHWSLAFIKEYMVLHSKPFLTDFFQAAPRHLLALLIPAINEVRARFLQNFTNNIQVIGSNMKIDLSPH